MMTTIILIYIVLSGSGYDSHAILSHLFSYTTANLADEKLNLTHL
jgi:hypothetical protein